MSKRCFKISGNFQQYGEWSQPDPGFIGYILVNDDGVFEGYMEEQYVSKYDAPRLVVGALVDDSKLAYYKLTYSDECAPLMYVFKDGISSLGEWFMFDSYGAKLGGSAKVILQAAIVDEVMLKKIKEVKELILGGGVPDWNNDLFERANELVEIFH